MTKLIAVVNAGASTLKVAMMEVDEKKTVREHYRAQHDWDATGGPASTVRAALAQLPHVPDAFGHRIVHGGPDYVTPARLTDRVEAALEALVALAPLHNGPALTAIREMRKLYPETQAVAVFDTAFHANRPRKSMRYALPKDIVEEYNLQRFGFHGIAHASLLHSLAEAQRTPIRNLSAVTLQLGAGCSACAIQDGRSIETSMGFTPLEGLVMSTRCGDIDPAIVLRLVRAGYHADQIEDILTRRSGLFALCGMIDMREILLAESRRAESAASAIDLFCNRIILVAGAYFTLLGGKGALVFGGGIGTNAPPIRERIARGLAPWKVRLDPYRNDTNEPGSICAEGARPAFVFRTDEETVIAREACKELENA